MPIIDGNYVQLTEDEILSNLESELQDKFGEDIDLTESSVFSSFAGAVATTIAQNQEQALSEIYDAAYLDTAVGEDLDNVVSIVGINRRPATKATGVGRFSREDTPDTKYSVSTGTTIQTSGDDPVKFETTGTGSIQLLEDAEDTLSNYDGNVSEFQRSTTQSYEGTYSVEGLATSDTVYYRNDRTIRQGHTISYRVYLNTGSVSYQYPVLEDSDNGIRAVFDDGSGEHRLEVVTSGTVYNSVSEGVTIPTGEWVRNEIRVTTQNEVVSTLYDSSGNEVSTITLDEGDDPTFESGYYGVGSGDGSTSKYWDDIATTAVSVDIRAVEGGRSGNNAANTLNTAPSPPNGFDSWTNPYPTGDNTYFDVDNDTFVVGRNEETDEELRRRTKQTFTAGGTATVDALLSSLINDIDDVVSVTIFENDTDTSAVPPNGTNSLPPYSFEAVVYGGNEQEIASQIFDTKAVTSRDHGGAHGTKVTKTVTSDINNDDYDVNFTRPTKVSTTVTVDIVVDDTYVGDEEIKDIITDYIGGTDTNGNSILGTDVGEDVYIDVIEDRIVGSDTGVVGVEVDGNGNTQISTSPSKTTNANNLQVISIGGTEVAVVDDASTDITVNTTTQ